MGVHKVLPGEKAVKEYTLLALLSAVIALALDYLSGTRLTRQRAFWIFLAVMFGFKLAVNGYLTARPIVLYGDPFFLGIRLGTIPVEDFLYGFSLITITVVCWEVFTRTRRPDGPKEG